MIKMYVDYEYNIKNIVSHICSNPKLPQQELFLRLAKKDDAIYYDLTDTNWRVVKILKGIGWEIREGDQTPTLFYREVDRHVSQVEPKRGYENDTLNKFINMLNLPDDPSTLLLFKVHLVSLFIPEIPHPIFLLNGNTGSGKTHIQKYVKRIVDPDNLEKLSIPKDERDFVLQASKNYLLSYDNVGYTERYFSDRICSVITGTGFVTRQLYTDSGDHSVQYRSSIILSTINKRIFKKPDFLNRCIIYDLPNISSYKREESLDKEFNEILPGLLGYIFDIIANAMKIAESMKSDPNILQLPRMADFAFWGEAIARSMGNQSNQFLNVYKEHLANRFDNDANYKNKSPDIAFIELVSKFVRSKGGWEGLMANLLNELKFFAKADNKKSVKLPSSAGALVRKIGLLKDALINKGIEYTNSRNEQNYSFSIFTII